MTSPQRRRGRREHIRIVFLCVLCASAATAEIIDRIAVTVDTNAVTQSRLVEEIRIVALLNGEPPDLSPQNRRRTAERLIDQIIMRREMDLTRYPQPTAAEIADTLKRVKQSYGGVAGFQAALQRYGLTEQQVQDGLLRQAAVLRFIEMRFRPEVQVPETDLMQYYDTVCVPEAQKKKLRPPTREQCDDALVSQRVDQRVEAWLKEMRGRMRIHFEEDAFQ